MMTKFRLSPGDVRRNGRVYAGIVIAIAVAACVSCSPYPVYNTSSTRDTAVRPDDPVGRDTQPGTEYGPEVASDADHQPPRPAPTVDGRQLRRIVDGYIGTPYARGGNDLKGIDCANLVNAIYRDYAGMHLPTTTRALYRMPDEVAVDNLEVGDLVFFSFGTRVPAHVGVYLGNRQFVHSSETVGVVMASLDDAAFRDSYRGARRVMLELHSSGE